MMMRLQSSSSENSGSSTKTKIMEEADQSQAESDESFDDSEQDKDYIAEESEGSSPDLSFDKESSARLRRNSKERLKKVELKTLQITYLETKYSLYKNILSYNIDCRSTATDSVKFNGFEAVQLETPVSILMQRDKELYDVFLSSDDEDDLEQEFITIGRIPTEDFVLQNNIIS